MEQTLYDNKKFSLSQSALKDWRTLAPSKWYEDWILGKRKSKRKRSMDFGQLLDTLCFTPDLFEKRFIIAECAKPSPKIETILIEVYEHLVGLNTNIKEINKKEGTKLPGKKITLVDNEDTVKKFCILNKHFHNKPDQAFRDVLKKGTQYFEFLKKLGHKVAITEEQEEMAKTLKEVLFTDPASRGFFKAKKGCEVLFQVQIYADFPISTDNIESIPIKGIIDIIYLNHNKKTVREVDLKFTDDVFTFSTGPNNPVKLFDYPTQHSFYNYLLEAWLLTYKDGAYKDYAIMNPLNVVIDDKIKTPYIYRYDFHDLNIKRKGIEGTWIKGWEEQLEEIAWHLDKNDWTRPKEHILNGSISIQIFNKK